MNALNGVLLVDKQSGVTSHDVVNDLRRALKIDPVGHGGTLDPLATGLLVCLLGEATKLSAYVMSSDKAYRVGIRFGVQTDSGDITGQVIKEGDASLASIEKIEAAVSGLTGPLELPVPKYSAIKVDGRKLYEYARKNQEVAVPIKRMTIHKALLVSCGGGHAVVDLDCGKGTYVRSWVEKLGELLGCGATVESLRRLRSGAFSVDQSERIDFFKDQGAVGASGKLVPMESVLGDWPALKVVGRDQALLRNGQLPKGIFGQLIRAQWDHGVRLLNEDGSLLAIVIKDPAKGLKLARVFNLQPQPQTSA